MEDFNSKYTGEQVEEMLDQIANGEISGGSSVYKWNWNSEMNGTFTEEEFENLSNADVVYITTGVPDMEMLYSVDGRVVVEDALHLGAHILSFETDTDNSKAAYVESITFIFDNSSKTWNAQGGNSELITNEQLTSALEDKQDKLVSGTNIKTINGESIVGSGDITIQGGGAAVDNVYITDFKVVDFIRLKEGEIEELQIDAEVLSEAIIAKKTILVPYDEDYVGGYGLLLGEVADTEIYFSIYTHVGQYIYAEAYDGIVVANLTIIRDIQMERVQQTSLDTLKNVAIANAVQTDGLLYAFPDQATGEEDEVLLSRGTVKTINGQTIMRDGDSDDINVAYPIVTTNSSVAVLQPNTVTKWTLPITYRDLELTFGEQPPQGYAVEYIATFNVDSDGVQLIVPDSVVWADGVYPAMTKGKTYEISIVDNLATFLEF